MGPVSMSRFSAMSVRPQFGKGASPANSSPQAQAQCGTGFGEAGCACCCGIPVLIVGGIGWALAHVIKGG